MRLEPDEQDQLIGETFARFFTENSTLARVRAAPSGFDVELWRGLAAMGALALRVPEQNGGMGLGLFQTSLITEQAGRTLVSAPLCEALVAARLLAELGGHRAQDWSRRIAAGGAVVTLALGDAAVRSHQWVAGGAVADAVLTLAGDEVSLRILSPQERVCEPNLASTPMAEIDLGSGERLILSSGKSTRNAFLAGVEEWKVLIAATLCGLSLEALRLAAAYACDINLISCLSSYLQQRSST